MANKVTLSCTVEGPLTLTNDPRHNIKVIKESGYQRLGEGHGRTVYDRGDGFVLKHARNKYGVAQNLAEIRNGRDRHPMLAPVTEWNYRGTWIVMVKGEKVKQKELRALLGGLWPYQFCDAIKNHVDEGGSDIVSVAYRLVRDKKMSIGDLRKFSSWATINGSPVLIDYGIDLESYTSCYEHKFNFNGVA